MFADSLAKRIKEEGRNGTFYNDQNGNAYSNDTYKDGKLVSSKIVSRNDTPTTDLVGKGLEGEILAYDDSGSATTSFSSMNEYNSYKSQQDQKQKLAEMQKAYQDLLGGMNNMQSEWASQFQQQAQQQAQQIAEEKKSALQNLIEKLNNNQAAGLQQINNSVQDSRQALEDKTFQKYLAARQNMANRGLSGSGIASDQDTRLLLQKQRDLSGIYRDAATRQFQLGNQYRGQLDDANRQLSGINTGEIASEKFQELYQQGNEGLANQAKEYRQYLADLMGYDIDNKEVGYKYDKLAEDGRQADNEIGHKENKLAVENQQFYDELETEYKYEYDKLSAENKQYYDKLKQNNDQEKAKLLLEWEKWTTPSGNNTQDNQTKAAIAEMDNSTKLQVAKMNNNARVQAAKIAASSREAAAKIRATAKKLTGSDIGNAVSQIISTSMNGDEALKMIAQESPNIISRFGMDGYKEAIEIVQTQQALEEKFGQKLQGGNFVNTPFWQLVEENDSLQGIEGFSNPNLGNGSNSGSDSDAVWEAASQYMMP